jgi:hypothetical protein
MSAPIDDGPPLIPGIDFTLGRPEPIDLRLAFNTLSDEEFDAAFGDLSETTGETPRGEPLS